MSMRTFRPLLGVLALTGCSQEPESPAQPSAAPAVVGGTRLRAVPCALRGATRYAQECLVESNSENGTTILIIRHPDGGFRRLEEVDGGKSFRAADGADTAVVTVDKDKLAVAVEEDHYLFPLPASAKSVPSADAVSR